VVYGSGGDVWFWRARVTDSHLDVEVCGDDVTQSHVRDQLQDAFGIHTRVQAVSEDRFVHDSWLADERVMQKPRFVFRDGESWEQPLSYF
jgi:hypothetical protein